MTIKRILLTFMLLIGILGTKAQEWRGFIEIYGGTSPFVSDINLQTSNARDMWNSLSFGLNYTMGVAVAPQIYAGVGIGGYTSMLNYNVGDYHHTLFPSLNFPVFANVRWIPHITKKTTPYVDLKIGYQWGKDLEDIRIWAHKGDDFHARHRNGFFLQPGAGIRFGRESAFNVGLAYNAFQTIDFVAIHDWEVTESTKKNYGSIMLTFGADF